MNIIGAGLVGSLWSILLAQKGYTVNVYERRSDMRKAGYIGGRSINLALSDRGFRALERAGIADDIRKVGIPMYKRVMHDTTGKLTEQAYGKAGEGIYAVSRGALNIALVNLAEKMPNVNFHFDHQCHDVSLTTNEISLLDTKTQTHKTIASPLTFATDGAFSAVRGALQKRPRFNYSQQYENYGYKELTIAAGESGRFLLEKNALHIWPRGHFMLIALPNLDGSFTCTLFLGYEGEQSFENLETDAQITAFFETYFADAKAMMPHLLDEFHANPVGTLVTTRCSPWSYKATANDNKIVLLGDAGRAIVPFYGQGMNAGFEDCTVLDDMLAAHDGDWTAAINEFDKTRPKDADAIGELALRNFVEMRDKVGKPEFLLRQQISAWLYAKAPASFTPLYSLVTFSHTPYSEALRQGIAQDAFFEKVLAIPNIATEWQTSEALLALFEDYIISIN
jgi:kynurenine 3-monooxygenase